MKRTPLYEYHVNNSKLVEFAGFEMPLWYTSISEEHLAVRNHVGIFDVSHMGRVAIAGPDASKLVDIIVPTFSSTQPVGKSFYTLLLNEAGGIIDDLIIAKRDTNKYLLVVNATNKEKDLNHVEGLSKGFNVRIEDLTSISTMIAIQGPEAIPALQPFVPVALDSVKRFRNVDCVIGESRAMITRTGYTGEDGFEVILWGAGVEDNSAAIGTWERLATNAKPCGLGSRDSLRLEAGLPLHGSDIDENTNPIEAELYWVVSREKEEYVGNKRLKELASRAPERIRRGIMSNERIPRKGFQVTNQQGEVIGKVTSGSFSPILKRGIALAYVRYDHSKISEPVRVVIRESPVEGRIVKLPFYDETVYGWKRLNR